MRTRHFYVLGKRVSVKGAFAGVLCVALLLLLLPIRWTGPIEKLCQALFAPAGRYTILAARTVTGQAKKSDNETKTVLNYDQTQRLIAVVNLKLKELEDQNRTLLSMRKSIDYAYGLLPAKVAQFDSLDLESVVIDKGTFNHVADGAAVLIGIADKAADMSDVDPRIVLATGALVGRIAYPPGPYTARVKLITSADETFRGKIVRSGEHPGQVVLVGSIMVEGTGKALAATKVPITYGVRKGDMVVMAEPEKFNLPVDVPVGIVDTVTRRIDSRQHSDLTIIPYFKKVTLDSVYILITTTRNED